MWLLLLFPIFSTAADFDVALAYGQSRDFWKTVQEVQDRTGNISDIQTVVRDKYGKPDLLYSSLDASYAFPQETFSLLPLGTFGTRAEAIAGGEISNPISPEIDAYATSMGIASLGLRSLPQEDSAYWDLKLNLGMGPEKKLYAQGVEFLEAIPTRSGTLFLAGAELGFFDRWQHEDFQIQTDLQVRPTYFTSTTDSAKSRPEKSSHFALRWKLQNEWLKRVDTFLSSRTQLGLLTVAGQNPLPFLQLPYTFDYHQRLRLYPGLRSTSGIGGIARLQSRTAMPNLGIYAGYFGGALGGGLDFQLGSVILSAATYGVENLIFPAREKSRIWTASIGASL
jgi:hypothetical protein